MDRNKMSSKVQIKDTVQKLLDKAGISYKMNVKLKSKYPKRFLEDRIDIIIVDGDGNHLVFIETRENRKERYCGFIKKEELGKKGRKRSWRYSLHGIPLYLIQDLNKATKLIRDIQTFINPKKELSFIDKVLNGEI